MDLTERVSPARVQVGIPWRPEPSRMASFERTVAWYDSHGFQVLTADSTQHHFNIAEARNILMRQMEAEVRILSDADTTPEIEPLWKAIVGAFREDLVQLPYHLYRLGNGAFVDGAHSGVYVATEAAWMSTNGQDEWFQGWGFEDNAWRIAHLTLNGPIPRHFGTVTAELHAEASRPKLLQNRGRYREYEEAYGDVERMKMIVGRSW